MSLELVQYEYKFYDPEAFVQTRERADYEVYWAIVNHTAKYFNGELLKVAQNYGIKSTLELTNDELAHLQGLMGNLNIFIEAVLARQEVEHNELYRKMRIDKYYEAWLLVQMILGDVNPDLHEDWPEQPVHDVLMRIRTYL